MDKLGLLIKTLSQPERYSFRHYLKLKSKGRDNQKITLLDLMYRQKASADIKKLVCRSETTDNNYYQLRKTLLADLELFMNTYRSSVDTRTEVLRKVDLAWHLIDRMQFQLAAVYLREAEELCNTLGYHELMSFNLLAQFKIAVYEPTVIKDRSSLLNRLSSCQSVFQSRHEMLRLITTRHFDNLRVGDRAVQTLRDSAIHSDDGFLTPITEWLVASSDLSPENLQSVAAILREQLESQGPARYAYAAEYHLLQARIAVKCKRWDEAAQELEALEKYTRSREQTPALVHIERYMLRCEWYATTGKIIEAVDNAERAWSKYHDVFSNAFRVRQLCVLINLNLFAEKYRKALHYLELLDKDRDIYRELHGQQNYLKMLLFKGAVHAGLNDEPGLEKVIQLVDRSVALDYFKKAISLLTLTAEAGYSSAKTNKEELREAFAHFAQQFPMAGYSLRQVDFRLWVRSKHQGLKPYDVYQQLNSNNDVYLKRSDTIASKSS